MPRGRRTCMTSRPSPSFATRTQSSGSYSHESKSALRSRSIIIVIFTTTCQRTGDLATAEHIGATVFSCGLEFWVFKELVEQDDEFAHDGDQGDFWDLACGD